MDSPRPDSTAADTASTPPVRKGVLAFVQSLKNPAVAQKSDTPSEVVGAPINKKGPLYHHFLEFSWAAQQNIWFKVSFIVHLVLVLLIWFGAYLTITRPSYIQVGATPLSQAAKNFFAVRYNEVDTSLMFDQLSFFSISCLTQLYQLDFDGANYVSLLQGMIKPEIIAKAKKTFSQNRSTIAAQRFIQNLVIQRVHPPIYNPQSNTFALFADGYFAIALQDSKGDPVNRMTPYRAKMLIQLTPPSPFNPFPFFMDELTDVFGTDECKKWDEENKKFLTK